MPFIFNPYRNQYPSLVELKEFVARLIQASINAHKLAKPNGVLSKTKVTIEGNLFNLQDDKTFDTQINIVLDRLDQINQKIYRLHVDNGQKVYNIVVDLEIRRKANEKTIRDLDEILEYLHQSFCFNSNSETEPELFTEQLTTSQGFTDKTYSSQLYGSNRLESVSMSPQEAFYKLSLKFLFTINKI